MHDGKTASENILTIFARSFWLLPLLASADPVPPNIKHVVEPLNAGLKTDYVVDLKADYVVRLG